jgi:hypothetical protein
MATAQQPQKSTSEFWCILAARPAPALPDVWVPGHRRLLRPHDCCPSRRPPAAPPAFLLAAHTPAESGPGQAKGLIGMKLAAMQQADSVAVSLRSSRRPLRCVG